MQGSRVYKLDERFKIVDFRQSPSHVVYLKAMPFDFILNVGLKDLLY